MLDRILHLVTTSPIDGVVKKPTGVPTYNKLVTPKKEILFNLHFVAKLDTYQTSVFVFKIDKTIG